MAISDANNSSGSGYIGENRPERNGNNEDNENEENNNAHLPFRQQVSRVPFGSSIESYIDENNRDQNLKKLESLLNETLKKWPEVEFMTSVDLGKAMKEL